MMSSKEPPYATMNDLPTYQEREKAGSAPWDKDQRAAVGSRVPEPSFFPSSQTAPFATSDNLPAPRQTRKAVTCAPWERDESHYPTKQVRCASSVASGKTAPFATEYNSVNNRKPAK